MDTSGRTTVAPRMVRWLLLLAAGLWVGYLMGDKDVGVAIVAAGYLLSWDRWPDRTRARSRN
ncbi:MAG TPA: hypothetical protein VHV82_01520 [Sporichthyaceae bacterium]|nr:hypothetical protein [Sporichthyaceae bacterium]